MCVKFQYCCFYCVSYESVCECIAVLLHGIDRCGGLQSVCEAVCESEEEFWEDVVMESTKKG